MEDNTVSGGISARRGLRGLPRLLSSSSSSSVSNSKSTNSPTLRSHKSAEQERTAAKAEPSSPGLFSGNSPRLGLFRKSAPNKSEPSSATSVNNSPMSSTPRKTLDPTSYEFQRELFIQDGLDLKSPVPGDTEEYFEWNHGGDEDDDDEEEDEDQNEDEPISPTAMSQSGGNAALNSKPRSGSKLYRSFSRVFRGGSKESIEDESKQSEPDSPRVVGRGWAHSSASMQSSSNRVMSPLMMKKRSIWSLDDEPDSPSLSRPTSVGSSRELMLLEEVVKLDDCIRDMSLRQMLMDALLGGMKEDVLFKVQFLVAVHETDFIMESELRKDKLTKIIKRFLGRESCFRLANIPEEFEEALLDRHDLFRLSALRTYVMEQLVQEESFLRTVHDCLRNYRPSKASGVDEDHESPAEAVAEYQV